MGRQRKVEDAIVEKNTNEERKEKETKKKTKFASEKQHKISLTQQQLRTVLV